MNQVGRAKTSIDILHERDAFELRIRALETALGCITREIELASVRPELSFVTLCRVSALARAASRWPA